MLQPLVSDAGERLAGVCIDNEIGEVCDFVQFDRSKSRMAGTLPAYLQDQLPQFLFVVFKLAQ